MGSKFRYKYLEIVILLFGLCISWTNSGTGDPYSTQPRLIIQNGHLLFQTAQNHNISFVSTPGGSIRINNDDIVEIIEKAKTTTSNIQQFGLSNLNNLNEQVGRLQSQLEELSQCVGRLNELEANYTRTSNRVNQLYQTFRTLNRRNIRQRLSNVENKVDALETALQENNCQSSPCRNGGTCIDAYNDFSCQCRPGWQGKACDVDVNECQEFLGTNQGCQNGGTCVNTVGSYSCNCPPNRYGVHCTQQQDLCNTASHQQLCAHGTCVNENNPSLGQPHYRCICDQGWTNSPGRPACDVDIDECNQFHPSCSQNPRVSCINLPGTFQCGSCPSGYTGNGHVCSDINECAVNNGGCSTHPMVQCINTPGSRMCGSCPPGYNGDGVHCQYTDVCNINNGGCHQLATCVTNTAISGTYRECHCPNGYSGSGIGPNGCLPSVGTACESNPCVNGRCQVVGTTYRCICSVGYTGTYCENTVDACHSNPCRNGGTCTSSAGGGFICACTGNWQGTTCEDEIESCGGNFYQETGNLQYPSDQTGQYQHGVSCNWVISTPNSHKVLNLTFASFNLEDSFDCSFDFLQINDGPSIVSRLVGRFCGSVAPGNGSLITTHNSVYLWFKSDESEAADGFHILWTSVDPVCGGDYTGKPQGSIKSPGYPTGYPHNRDCYWKVEVPNGKRIKFHFVDFRIEHHENCSYDFLQIYDGLSEHDPVLKTFCGMESTIPPLTTSGSTSLLYFHSDQSLTDAGFLIAFSSEERIAGCGGLLTEAEGHFSSPHFPNIYSSNLRCEWLIRLPRGERIALNFTFFDVEGHSTCGYDYVEIIDGENEEDGLIGRYCNTIRPPRILSSSNKLRIIFSTDYSLQMGGFIANYTTACGGTFTDISGDIHSPNYPNHYPLSKTCYYQIIVPQGNIIELNFLFFDIEESFTSDCTFDYLEIRDVAENGALLGKFCGVDLPGVIRSSYNHLWMKFVSDGSVQNLGFLLNYTSTEIGCGAVLTEITGVISTPNSITERGFLTCNWLLRADPGYIVRLNFAFFSLRNSEDCINEYLEVFDTNGEKIGRYCGEGLPPTLTSTDNEMKVTFRTFYLNLPEGFSASYQYMDSTHACGGDYYTQSGIVRSPGFTSGYYPHQRDCTWILHVNTNKQISVHVTAFHLESHTYCNYDFLEIRNGGYPTSPLVGKYCGDNGPSNFTSHSNTLWLHFVSDHSYSALGFELFYESTVEGCGGVVTAQEGSIISPNFPESYHHNAECNWLIQVAQGSVVKFVLREVDIERHPTCNYDFLQIYDGDSERARTILKICQSSQYHEQQTSSTNKLFIKFRTDYSANARGFQLVYQAECNTILRGYRGVIESPNFPSPYPHNINCTWTIMAPLGNNISIAFSHFTMEYSSDCSYDSLEIAERSYDTENQIVKYCGGESFPEPVVTSHNVAIIRFKTDHSVSMEGFRIEWQVRGCGGHLMKSSGNIESPNYPNTYPLSVECFWYIAVSPGQKIEFTIEHASLESSQYCSYDYVKVYGGEDENSHEIATYCGNINRPQTVTSHGNHMTIHFHSDISYGGMGFKARYNAVSGGCGGLYTADSGTLTSPNYNNNFGIDDDCTWIIEVDNNHLIELHMEDFDISPPSPNCSSSYLAIYDGPDEEEGSLLLRHCGSSLPTPTTYQSTSNYLFLHMKPDGVHTSRGFSAAYSAVCGARINADDGGEITSPNYPHAMVGSAECTWILYATDLGEKITIIVTDLSTDEIYNPNCTYEQVQIRSGTDSSSPLIQQFCGNRIPPPIRSFGNTVYISFRGNKFRATYGVSNNVCGGTFLAEHGTFTSPDYPNSYPINTECVWNISAAAGNKIHLSFSSFEIEEDEYCNTDFVEIREDSDSGNLIGKYCGSNIPGNVTKVSNRFWIKFRSDEVGTGAGFVATYSLVHGVQLNGTEGIIESPGYPHFTHRNEEYTWLIMAPVLMYVKIEFLVIDLEEETYGSCISYVMIIDGAGQYGLERNRYCTRTLPEPVVTSNNIATIKFYNGHVPGRWQLKWTAVNEPSVASEFSFASHCWENLYVNASNTTTIQSAGYPESYANNLNCSWVISTGENRHVKLDFMDISTEGYMPSCYYDRISLYEFDQEFGDSWKKIGSVCGRLSSPMSFSGNSSVMKVEFTTDSYFTSRGFKAVARSECGGKVFSSRGILNTSDAAPSYGWPPCKWIIVARPGRTIRLTFEQFNIPDDASCSSQYLLIRNGGEATSPFLGSGKYCNNNNPQTLESLSNKLYIQLTSQYNYHSHPQTPIFLLRYEEVSVGCGGQTHLTISEPSVIITSPNHPNVVPHDVECEWVVMGPPNTRLRLDFNDRMDIEYGCHQDNSTEFIEVRDGGTINSDVLGRFCGRYQPSSTFTTGNIMSIRYVTTGKNSSSGFSATVLIANCGGTIYGYNFTLTSPNYPLNYENNMECVWLIKTWYSLIFKIYFEDMAIIDEGECYNDYVMLREESESGYYLGKECGMRNITDVLQSEQYIVYVKFKTNSTGTGRGFKIRFVAEHSGCGGEIRSPSGVIQSPGFPSPVSYRRFCRWQIYVDEGNIITLTFQNFNLRRDPVNNTCINALAVWNGTDAYWNFEQTHWICGNQIPGPFESVDNSVSVYYYSYGNMFGEGFRMGYTSDKAAACGGKLTSSSGTISSPGFENGTLPTTAQCVWRLRNERDVSATLAVEFDILELPSNSTTNCLFDYLIAQEGDVTNVNHNSRRICGNYTGRRLLVSTPSNALLIALRKNSSEAMRGFNATYSIQECGGEIEIGTEGTSPLFPNNYPPNSVCHWRITTESGNEIKLSFSEFELENNCSKDYVEIRSGQRYDSPIKGTFCGNTLPREITSDSNHLTVVFHSDQTGSARGFRFTTSKVQRGCGGIVIGSESFSSPVIPNGNLYPNNAECTWLLESDIDYHHNITFINRFDIERTTGCVNDYVQVEEYENSTWKFLKRFCGNIPPPSVIGRSNHMRVIFQSNSQTQGDGFTVLHTVGCGRTFLMEDSGIITSPGYPHSYRDQLNCEYLIQNSEDSYITLQFDEVFSIEDHPRCEFDVLIIYAGNSTSSPQIGNYCGNAAPGPFISKGAMLLIFKTDWVVTNKGFRATFSVTRCGGYLSNPEGTFKTPYIPVDVDHSINCTWVIAVEPQRVIELKFLHFDLKGVGCLEGSVRIYNSDHIGRRYFNRYCGASLPPLLKSDGSFLTVYFYMPRGYRSKGFEAAYRTTFGPDQGCGGRLVNAAGEISSFDFDNDGKYESQVDCIWYIYQSGKLVHITFTSMDIEPGLQNNGSCLYDYVQITDGFTPVDPLLGKFCGTELPREIVSTAGRVMVHFHSDSTNQSAGFHLRYEGKEPICGGTLYVVDESQRLTSPNYPQPYEPNLRCQWRFYKNNTRFGTIELTFDDMDMPCGGDYLEFREDGVDHRPLQFCGQHVIHHFRARHGLVMNFVTNMEGAGRGFSLSYATEGCSRNYTRDNGIITNPNYPWRYFYEGNCDIIIFAQEGHTISLYFNSFTFWYVRSHISVCNGYGMEIHEGVDDTGALIGRFCGDLPNPVFSHSNALFIRVNGQYSSFAYSISYTTTDQGQGCGGNLTSINGTFTSPKYPFPCNITAQCHWYIAVPGQHTLTLKFPIFALNSTRGCETNYVEIYETHEELSSNRVGRYCGTDRPAEHSSLGNTVMVKMVTNTNNNAPGFKATFHTNSLGTPTHHISQWSENAVFYDFD